MRLQGKHILLGISGGIAAYKSASLARLLIREGAEVQVVMTPSAKEFITPLTMATLTCKPVVSEFFDRRDGTWHSHVNLGLWSDLFLIAPATASTIAKMATGIADNMLITTYLSMKGPTWVAPAMDLDMYAHSTTRQNIETLKQQGVGILEASTGFLASGLEGKGRMMEPESIVEEVCHFFCQSAPTLKNKKVLITAGPTYEPIDPVRYIGNHSSGRMGIEIARSACQRGAEVELILGPSLQRVPEDVSVTRVTTAIEMLNAAEKHFPTADIAIFSAAVADYRPATYHSEKIKREKQGTELEISFVKNPDIAAILGSKKTPDQFVVGFALETSIGIEEAKEKMKKKNFDLIVLNSLKDSGAGFGTTTNKVTLLQQNKPPLSFPLKDKREVANDIMNTIIDSLLTRHDKR